MTVQPVASFYPASLVSPNSYDATDFDTNTDLSSVPDVTAAVQAALDACGASGQGGTVWLPSGVIRMNGVTISRGGVTLRGAGWEEYPDTSGSNYPAKRGKRGTYVLTDSIASSTVTIANTANNARVLDMAFIQTQPHDDGGWAPRAFPATITVNGNNSGHVFLEHLLFWGVTNGIALGSANMPINRCTMRDLHLAVASVGIDVVYSLDAVALDNCQVVPQLLVGSPNTQGYIQKNAIGVRIGAATKISISSFAAKNILKGISFIDNTNGAALRAKIVDADFDGVQCGIHENCASVAASARINGITCLGAAQGASQASIALYAEGAAGSHLYVTDLYGTKFEGPAIAAVGSGLDLRLGGIVWLDNWNTSPPVSGFANPAPGIHAGGGNTVFYSTATKFSNANGGPNTGGGGTFTTY